MANWQFVLIFFMLAFGGVSGGFYLFIINGFQFAPREHSASDVEAASSEGKPTAFAYASAWFGLLNKIFFKLILLVPLILDGNSIPVLFFLIDVYILVHTSIKTVYWPGSLYNEIHFILSGREFHKVLQFHQKMVQPHFCLT